MDKISEVWQRPNGRKIHIKHPWYLAGCDNCGWIGSSEKCGTDPSYFEDTDVYCPKCHTGCCDSPKKALNSLTQIK